MSLELPPLYPILDTQISPVPLTTLIPELALAKIRLVQLRSKKATSKAFFEEALQLIDSCRACGISVIINDRVDIAWLTDADGVHVGQDDLPVTEARKILGPEKLIGLSTHSLQQALEGQESEADYVAIGPVFTTLSKQDPDPVIRWEELVEVRKRVTKPLVAIGGITSENVRPLFEIGIDSVAVIRDLLLAENRAEKARHFLRLARR